MRDFPFPKKIGGFMNSITFTFDRLPQNVEEMKALPEAVLDSPYKAAALTVLALCRYGENKDDGIEMLNFLKGPAPLSAYQIQFLKERFMDGKKYIPFSYFDGATPENNYTPSMPYSITVFDDSYSNSENGYYRLNIRSGGADSPRQVKLRAKGGTTWFLWEQYLMVGIRTPVKDDPWA